MNPATLSALAEPRRLEMVELLRSGPLTVGEIADRLQVRQPQVSKHLKVLNEARIVEVEPVANRRIYRLRPEPLQELDAWIASFRNLWEGRFDRLDEYLQEIQNSETSPSQANMMKTP
ncbi:ArsR/SmtB family transcription factor [Paenibacillus phocaensis]|uniref:ArsR/SmtB family transcription factor n=1 Tax=Paenibacillus phocaensis TaxID=1776378 RepID=UPI000399E74C|nr:metalloregulator ArsR/SmtB family transcription factor [Paenibacillus phocaensis]